MRRISRNFIPLVLVSFFWINDTRALKDVELDIDPRIVQRGDHSTLRCSYDLEGSQLYTVKWYRGTHEFYRYTPSEHPSTKIFPYTGVHVDLELSNEQQVVLRKVGFNLSGNFSCEVTTEAPLFSTAVVSKDMLVVVMPDGAPALSTDKAVYSIGDVLRANCTSPPSRPAAILSFLLNNIKVCDRCMTRKHLTQELFQSDLSLELPLFPLHFSTGRLVLRCVAQIGDLYQQHTELRLDKHKEPVPQQITSPNGSSSSTTNFTKLEKRLLAVLFCLVVNYWI